MIFTLHARLNHPDAGEVGKTTYFYDDPAHGVYCEQLVKSTSEAIHCILLSAGLWDDETSKPEHVTLRFTADPQACMNMQLKMNHPIVKLHYNRRDTDNEMSVYGVEGYFPQSFVDERDFMDDMGGPTQVDLCDHLIDYFATPPTLFYCQVSLTPQNSPQAGS